MFATFRIDKFDNSILYSFREHSEESNLLQTEVKGKKNWHLVLRFLWTFLHNEMSF